MQREKKSLNNWIKAEDFVSNPMEVTITDWRLVPNMWGSQSDRLFVRLPNGLIKEFDLNAQNLNKVIDKFGTETNNAINKTISITNIEDINTKKAYRQIL